MVRKPGYGSGWSGFRSHPVRGYVTGPLACHGPLALKPSPSSASPVCGEASPLLHRAVGSASVILLWVASNRL